MAFAVTNDFTGASTLDPADLDENFADVETILNAGLTTANLATNAGIANAQLANDDYTFTITGRLSSAQWNAGAEMYLGLPDYTGSVYTVLGYSWSIIDVGSQDATFSIKYGLFAANAFVSSTTIAASVTINGADANNCRWSGGASCSVDITPVTSGQPKVFQILPTAAGTSVLSTATDCLDITLFLKRKNGLGSY